jgi:hypothetical protein
MPDRFDLEQEIMQCWNIVDDVKLLQNIVSDEPYTEDFLQNYLLGLQTIYQGKFERLFNTFEQLVRNREL